MLTLAGDDIRWRHYSGIFVLSSATLLLELSLVRILSVSNWYHFGFLVISTALLGFGASGTALSLWPRMRNQANLDRVLAPLAALFGVVTLASFWLMQKIPFDPFKLLADRSQWVYTLLYYLVLASPFFCSGLAIALLLSRGGARVNRLYAADLVGAGLGCVAITKVLEIFGGPGSVVVSAVAGFVAALAFRAFRPSKFVSYCLAAAATTLALAFIAGPKLPLRVIPGKLHSLQPVGESPIYSKWNSFSKIDVYKEPAAPDRGRPDPGFSIIIDAGTAGTAIPDLSVGVRNYLAHPREYQPSGVAYVGRPNPKVLIIGSGAGREVLEALYFGASSITAVDVNPTINDTVTRRMSKEWGGLFTQPEVHLVTEDARSFVRRSKEKYDIIISLNTMSEAALASGGISLSEGYVITREAVEDYWNHLTPNGTFLETGYQLPKVFATIREMFDNLGLGSPADHVAAFRGLLAPYGASQLVDCVLLQKKPFQKEEVSVLANRLGVGRYGPWGDGRPPEILYSPFQTSGGFQLLFDLMNSPELGQIYSSNPNYIQPATDDKPFFYRTERWRLRGLGFRRVLGAGLLGNSNIDNNPVIEVTLIVLLAQTGLISGVMILAPLLRSKERRLNVNGRLAFFTYFGCLGLGFILIEIVLLQKLSLFLGQPIYTFAVVLGSLLICSGIGSYLAGRVDEVSSDRLSLYVVAIVALIVSALLLLPKVLSWTLGFSFPWRMCIAILLIAPLGVPLGVPFPTGLRMIEKEASLLVPWAWAVNSFFTVIGSVIAIILGMTLGFTAVLAIAAALYAVALVAIRTRGAASSVSLSPERRQKFQPIQLGVGD
jgi:hypothetical protein